MFKLHCNICKKSNHSTKNCRYKNQTERSIHHFENKNHNQNSQNHDRNRQPPNFQYQQTFCPYCKKQGHLTNECRKRQCNNNKKSQINHTNPSNDSNSTNNSPLNSRRPCQPTVISRGVHSGRISKINVAVTTYVFIYLSNNNEIPCNFLIDTGADNNNCHVMLKTILKILLL